MKMGKVKDFTLNKIKRTGSEGVIINYTIHERDGSEFRDVEMTMKNPKMQHGDLDKALDRLKPHLSKILGTTWVDTIMNSSQLKDKEKTAFQQLELLLDTGHKTQTDKLEINGISIHNEEEKRQVVIIGTMYTDNKRKIAINSPLIALNQKSFGFEVDLMKDVEEIIEEVGYYLFDGKKARLEDVPVKEAKKDHKLEKVA